MSEIENKIKEANKLVDKELRKIYFEEKRLGIKRKYYYIIGFSLIFAGFVL